MFRIQVHKLTFAAAKKLAETGLGPDIVVGICIDEGVYMILVQLAVLMAGAALVPVDMNQPRKYSHLVIFGN
jgi:non-ribosomal peptide synthetase component F